MTNQLPIHIPLSKKKLWLLLLAAVVFVGLSGWYLMAPPDVRFLFLRNPALIRLVGLVGLILFGAVGIFIVRKLGDQRNGLEISDAGFMDNSSGVSAGFVPWSDVTGIQAHSLFGQPFLLVFVRNPDAYINRQDSALKRRGMRMNHKQNGTPISLNANALQVTYADLKSMLIGRFGAYQVRGESRNETTPD